VHRDPRDAGPAQRGADTVRGEADDAGVPPSARQRVRERTEWTPDLDLEARLPERAGERGGVLRDLRVATGYDERRPTDGGGAHTAYSPTR
jgi:hypothetical protein